LWTVLNRDRCISLVQLDKHGHTCICYKLITKLWLNVWPRKGIEFKTLKAKLFIPRAQFAVAYWRKTIFNTKYHHTAPRTGTRKQNFYFIYDDGVNIGICVNCGDHGTFNVAFYVYEWNMKNKNP
jgi:hypothetical protein